MDLPDLVQGRQAHACGYFVNEAGHRVHLVTGGYGEDFLSSTEILYNGDPAWTTAGLGHLPAPANGLRGVSVDNNILVTGSQSSGILWTSSLLLHSGGLTSSMSTLDETVMFNKQTQSWDTVGHLNKAISAHAASLVSLDDVIEHCS